MSAKTSLPVVGACAVLFLGAAATHVSPASPSSKRVDGPCATAFNSQICSWAETSNGAVTAVGVTVPMQAINGAPDDAPMDWPPVAEAVVPMPQAAQTATGITELTFYWEPHGHPPAPYLTPHFDFHFNMISNAARMAIDCSNTKKPAALPTGYALPDAEGPDGSTLVGLCVPEMGMHALEASALQDTTLFSDAMVLGYYAQRPVFWEPMIARAKLRQRQSFSLAVPTMSGLPAGVRSPSRIDVEYDASIPGYRFVLSGFTK